MYAILAAVAGALLRCLTLAVLVPRRVGRLALHPATAPIISQLIPGRRLRIPFIIFGVGCMGDFFI